MLNQQLNKPPESSVKKKKKEHAEVDGNNLSNLSASLF